MTSLAVSVVYLKNSPKSWYTMQTKQWDFDKALQWGNKWLAQAKNIGLDASGIIVSLECDHMNDIPYKLSPSMLKQRVWTVEERKPVSVKEITQIG